MMNKGFTLIELMIVVAIIVVLSTFGVMSISDRIEKNAILTVKSELPTTMRNAIDKSFSDGVARSVSFNVTNSSIEITGASVAAISYDIPNILKATMTPTTFKIGEKGEIRFNDTTTTQAAITVKTKKNVNVITIKCSNMGGTDTNPKGIYLGKITVQ